MITTQQIPSEAEVWARVVTALAGSAGCGKPEVAIRWADEIAAAYRARFGKASK